METRNYQARASATPPDAPVSPSNGYPSNGNPSSGQSATQPGAHWFYKIGEELRNLIVNAGLIPADGDLTQLYQAVKGLISSGGAIKSPVRVATTANIATLSGGAPSTLDGIALAAGDRILVKDQTTASQNGLYVVATLGTGSNGTWTRATDSDVSSEIVAGMLVVVAEGDVAADTIWELTTNAPIVLGTTGLVFARKDGQTVTAVSDPTFADNSSKAASTSWVKSLLINLAQWSYTQNGYMKFPVWLGGGLIIQWGITSTVPINGTLNVVFPITFPNVAFICLAGGTLNTISTTQMQQTAMNVYALSQSGFSVANDDLAMTARWFALGY